MDELLNDFIVETNEHLEAVTAQLVRFERDSSDASSIASVFRLVHTIKGTCGFLELPRLERLSHAAETVIGRVRDRGYSTAAETTLILSAIDRIRHMMQTLEAEGREPDGDDADLVAALENSDSTPAPVTLEPAPVEPPQPALAFPATPPVSQQPVSAQAKSAQPMSQQPAMPQPTIPQQPTSPRTTEADKPRDAGTIRVAVGTLERIMRLVSELVLARNQILDISRSRSDDAITAPLQRLSAITTDLQDGVMHARMQPIERLFANLPRLVRDLSRELGKKVDLVLEGSDTELDRQLVELIRDPLTHMIRNCLDHGLETPAERIACGKSETGVVRVSAAHEAGHITIAIADDGRGLDVDRIRAKALASGLASEADLARMSADEMCRFIFSPGFSTAQSVTNVSGRGIGMDVVRENIESIGGAIALSTKAGHGTVFTLKVPLTLAIAPALIIEVAGHRFAIPQHAVVEAVSCGEGDLNRVVRVQGAPMLVQRDQTLPLADLRSLMRLEDAVAPATPPRDGQTAVIVRYGASLFGIAVDAVSDVQEIVVKPMGRSLAHLTMFAGNTILGDGSVVLILNPAGLASTVGIDNSNQFRVEAASAEPTPEKNATTFIQFRAGDGPLKALPLSVISRIESAHRSNLSHSQDQIVLLRAEGLTPIVALADIEEGRDEWPVLIIGVGGEPMGLLVSEIVDIVNHTLEIDIAGQRPSVVGYATIGEQSTEVLDIAHYMKIARPGAFERGHARRFRILLVDDKQFFRDMLAPVISAAGYEISAAGSAAEALAMIKRGFVFDAVVTDVDMPGIDGYTFARTLRENPRYRETPIIALDAFAGAAIVEAAKAAGMNGVVGKFDRATLLTTLARALEACAFSASALEKHITGARAA